MYQDISLPPPPKREVDANLSWAGYDLGLGLASSGWLSFGAFQRHKFTNQRILFQISWSGKIRSQLTKRC
jgi:hypothetical protein